jgi:hypothetical protein
MRGLTREVETCRHCATLAIVSYPEKCRSRIDHLIWHRAASISTPREKCTHIMCTRLNLQCRYLATSSDNTDCDAVTRDPLQSHFLNKGAQQSLLAVAIDLGPLPDFRYPDAERKTVILLFSTRHLRFACLSLTTGERILRRPQSRSSASRSHTSSAAIKPLSGSARMHWRSARSA